MTPRGGRDCASTQCHLWQQATNLECLLCQCSSHLHKLKLKGKEKRGEGEGEGEEGGRVEGVGRRDSCQVANQQTPLLYLAILIHERLDIVQLVRLIKPFLSTSKKEKAIILYTTHSHENFNSLLLFQSRFESTSRGGRFIQILCDRK